MPVYDFFRTGDGQQIFLGAVTEGQWTKLCEVLGLEELKADPRLQNRPDQIAARDWTLPIIEHAVAQQSFVPLAEVLEREGIPFSPIARPAQMFDDSHVNRPGGLFASALPEGGSFRAPGLPFEVDGAPAVAANTDLPQIGADTAEILGSLGLTVEDIHAAAGRVNREAM